MGGLPHHFGRPPGWTSIGHAVDHPARPLAALDGALLAANEFSDCWADAPWSARILAAGVLTAGGVYPRCGRHSIGA